MKMLKFILINIVLVTFALTITQAVDDTPSLRCLNSTSHKLEPSVEDSLKGECKRWKSLSCCSATTTDIIHAENNYWADFNYDHCYRLSPKCRRRFRQELCFYECDPYLGLWIVRVKDTFLFFILKNKIFFLSNTHFIGFI
jgi:hypothetical protein